MNNGDEETFWRRLLIGGLFVWGIAVIFGLPALMDAITK